MKTTLIKTTNGYVLVSDETAKEGECYLTNSGKIEVLKRCYGGNGNYYNQFKKVISEIPTVFDLPVMQLSDCEAVERGFDVDAEYKKDMNIISYIGEYKRGFNKALKLTADRIFTKADVIDAYQEGSRYSDDNVHVYPNAIKYAESLIHSQREVECDIIDNNIVNLKRV